LSILDDANPDYLISELAGPLSFDAARAFRHAAVAALGSLTCYGPGIAYRTVGPIQAAFFTPPSDARSAWDIADERLRSSGRLSRLLASPPLAEDSERQQKARRSRWSRFQAVG
jgi:hypothetical protein